MQKAKSILELLIRQAKLPPKPKPGIDMAVFREMKELLHRLRKCASEIKQIQDIAQTFHTVIDNSGIIMEFCYTLRYNLK